MKNCTKYNMPIIMPCMLLLRDILLKHVWDTFHKSPMDFYFGEVNKEDGQDGVNKSKRFIERIQ
jgi:hypothetical protein